MARIFFCNLATEFVITRDTQCYPYTGTDWHNIADAKQTCSEILDCGKIQDTCGEGNSFSYCNKDAMTRSSSCRSILYTKGMWVAYRNFVIELIIFGFIGHYQSFYHTKILFQYIPYYVTSA